MSVDAVIAEIEAYHRLPKSEHGKLRSDVADVLEWIVETVDGATLDPQALHADIWDTAARRARQGIAYSDVLASYDLPWMVCLRSLFATADTADQPTLVRLLQVGAEFSGRELMHDAYYTELGRLSGGSVRAEALLGGGDLAPDETGSGFWVLVVRPPHAPPVAWVPPALPAGSVAAARPDHLVVVSEAPPARWQDRPPPVVQEAYRLVAADFPGCTACAEYAAGADTIPAAHRNAAAAARMASPLARRPLAVSEVAVDLAVAADPETAAGVLSVLSALDRHPDLTRTLEMFYETDMDRLKVADSLNLHRNTVNYRLTRVETLTGIDPTSVRGVRVFTAGLAARRAAR